VFLEEGASAFGAFEHTLDAQTQPVFVRQFGAGPGVGGADE
jgi:hypothetical protein